MRWFLTIARNAIREYFEPVVWVWKWLKRHFVWLWSWFTNTKIGKRLADVYEVSGELLADWNWGDTAYVAFIGLLIVSDVYENNRSAAIAWTCVIMMVFINVMWRSMAKFTKAQLEASMELSKGWEELAKREISKNLDAQGIELPEDINYTKSPTDGIH